MANPAPTINQINAFNATQGTIIDFNIIGGTELVRSNRIYIYDLSDNSLICTHLYVSTESIHELPANTDSSIVYESGKSSADFVNGAQYYAQIQTYTDTAGTEGGSGLSVAKMFWCLVDPTLTITTIPSTISTTSYNVSATYDANTSVVSNIIQQYQFSLYSATGSLLQSSGVIVGSGTQQGTSTAYDISYNFTGLSVGSSYYVVVDVTTTQGMSVSTQSNTFTVSIETPTLGEATVVNNACDGYISVTSNLSGEYGGSASGEIATFVTDSVNDVSSLKVTLTPQQDGTPWIGTTHDTTPYLNRAMPSQSNDYNRESGVIVGGTVSWNQLINHGNFDSLSGWINPSGGVSSTSIANNIATITANATAIQEYSYAIIKTSQSYAQGHRLLFTFDAKTPKSGKIKVDSNTAFNPIVTEWNVTANQWKTFSLVGTGAGVSAKNIYIFPKALTDGYEVGDAWQIKNVMCIDLTAMFGSTVADYIYSLEQSSAGAGVAWFRKYFPEDYYPYHAVSLESVQATAHKTYDGDGNVIGNYALDSSLTLRGIPKLDASNNLYYDGDTYASDGTVTRKYGIVDLGTLSFNKYGSDPIYYAMIPNKANGNTNILSNKFFVDAVAIANMADGGMRGYSSDAVVYFRRNDCETLADWNTWLTNNPTQLVYELATPTTETATAYTNPQIVDPDGTEEYVTANYVPVGHDSTYALVCPISGYDEVSANVVGKNWFKNFQRENTTVNGLTFTNNGDGTVTVNGTATAATIVSISSNTSPYQGSYCRLSHMGILPNVSYKIHGCPSGGSREQFMLQLLVYGSGAEPCDTGSGSNAFSFTEDVVENKWYRLAIRIGTGTTMNNVTFKPMICLASETDTDYEPYQGQTYTADLPQTVYGGTVDLVSGVLTVDRAMETIPAISRIYDAAGIGTEKFVFFNIQHEANKYARTINIISDRMEGVTFIGRGQAYTLSVNASSGNRIEIFVPSNATVNEINSVIQNGIVVYELATPQEIQLTPQEIQTLVGTNNVWSEDGDVEITYNIPITNLLVKRQDVADVSGSWLTLYSQPVTQASDMDFTFIDFLNQYGKTYKYALVPLLTQTQSGVEVEVEGGYTVSDEVQSIFDGVFIVDSTGSQKCKANVGYGDVDMNQAVGTITPIGSKYPVVITNSKNQYHNGSISGTIVPDDYYFNGNLSRIDMVNKRNALEQFLTNKRVKIIKDWNSNIWLVMIMDNINCTFNNEYGMGIVNFTANWIEVGDPTNQQDLQATGLIDVGGA